MSDRQPFTNFEPYVEKILFSIAFLIQESEGVGFIPTQYDIVKSLFLADRSHLNEWGRPITYDNYVAMIHGPVPSLAYDFLKENTYAINTHKIQSLPWLREDAGSGNYKYFTRGEMDFEEVLSPSDRDALRAALSTVRKLGFMQIKKLTHEDPAYIDAWENRNGLASSQMNVGLMFDDPNFDEAEHIGEFSPYVRTR